MHKPFWTLLALLLGVSVAAAQPGTCPALVDDAIDAANENCLEMNRNEVCYGHHSLRATFYESLPPDAFDEPTERLPLTDVQRIETAAPSLDMDEVGVALMKLQAMLPNTLPGQSVVFVMVGDVQVEDTTGAQAAAPTDPVSVTLATEADVYTGPGDDYAVAATIDAGTAVEIDGTTTDRTWYRVILDESLAWVPAASLPAGASDLSDLAPVRGTYGPMQAFTLTTGIGVPGCEEAPSSLLVQGPEAVEVTLNVNGVDVTVGSSVVFEATAPDELEVAVIDGSAQVSDNQIVLGGFRARVALDPQTRRAVGGWSPTEAIPDERLAALSRFERMDARLLNYSVAAPRAEQIQERIRNGELDIQNNFGALTPDQRRAYRAYERKLTTQLALRNMPGVRARVEDALSAAETDAERARIRAEVEATLGNMNTPGDRDRLRAASQNCSGPVVLQAEHCATPSPPSNTDAGTANPTPPRNPNPADNSAGSPNNSDSNDSHNEDDDRDEQQNAPSVTNPPDRDDDRDVDDTSADPSTRGTPDGNGDSTTGGTSGGDGANDDSGSLTGNR